MGSKDQRHSRVDIFHQGYVVPLEVCRRATVFLKEQERSLVAVRRQSAKMGEEMPLEQLLALYGYTLPGPVLQKQQEPNELAASLPEITPDEGQMDKDLFSGKKKKDRSSAHDLTPSLTSHTTDLLDHHLRGNDKDTSVSSSEDDSESSSIPSSDGCKHIMVGSKYQAVIPSLCSHTCNERVYENEDQLLWTPDVLSSPAVEEFLIKAQRRGTDNRAADSLTTGDTVKDNEQALYELVKCNFNGEEALRRFHFNVKVFSEELCAWSEDECRGFEHGYRVHGKNFHLIQANKVRTRSVGECVEYYYMWKKSERHEYFTQQASRLGRKKCNIPSGNVEDAEPDKDMGEVEGATQGLPRSSSSLELQPPSPPSGMELDKQASEGDVGKMERRAPPQVLRIPVKDCPSKASMSTQLYLPLLPRSHAVPSSQPNSGPLGAGLYPLQLGSFPEDSLPACSECVPIDFSLPIPSPVTPSIAVPDFGL